MPKAKHIQGDFRWPRRRPVPKWKQAEEYFRQYRDPQLKVTLPKLKCLMEPRHG